MPTEGIIGGKLRITKGRSNLDLLLGSIIVVLFIGLSWIRLPAFEAMERFIYDAEMRSLRSNNRSDSQIAIIEIDEKSTERLGEWPWPRYIIAELLVKLDSEAGRIIGLNLPFVKKEANLGLKEVKGFSEKAQAYPAAKGGVAYKKWVLENLSEITAKLDGDRKLVKAVEENGKVILPAFSHQGRLEGGGSLEHVTPALHDGYLTQQDVPAWMKQRFLSKELFLPFNDLTQAALGLGVADPSRAGSAAGWSYPMFINYRGMFIPSFPLRIAIAYLNQKPEQVRVESSRIRLKNTAIPLSDGEMLVRYRNGGLFNRYSFIDVFEKEATASALTEKIVLIGFGATEESGIDTPISPAMSEIEWSAHVLENALTGRAIVRPPLMGYFEALAILLLGLIGSYFAPRMGILGRTSLLGGLILLVLICGFTMFLQLDLWFKTTYVVCCLVTVYLVVSVKPLFTSAAATGGATEAIRLLGLDHQARGRLDLAFDQFRKLPLNDQTKNLIYKLGLEYENEDMTDKALSAYEHINEGEGYRDLDLRIQRLKSSVKSSEVEDYGSVAEPRPLEGSSDETRLTVGRYQILEELGKGSMGLVYKALDPKINRLLAIKTIRFSDEFDDDVIDEIKERFFREAEIAGRLSHPSIVTVYDVGEDRDLTYMAMELLEGEDLDKFINKESLLSFMKVLGVTAKVADALGFAHSCDVIHRDIKPANIMLLKEGGVKVTDFGIAKALSSSRTRTGVILGTPNYMSPEQIMGQKIDERSDIFSLGVLLFQLLTGELPFRGDNLSSLLYQITQVRHPSVREYNPKVPKACGQIIDRALAKKPEERFKNATDMAKVIRLLVAKIDQLRKKT
jgi:serine/threonine-protein kinase